VAIPPIYNPANYGRFSVWFLSPGGSYPPVYGNTDGHVDREKVPKIEVEVDLAGSHSRLALGTESPLSDPKNS
jgi:hypothetical protein